MTLTSTADSPHARRGPRGPLLPTRSMEDRLEGIFDALPGARPSRHGPGLARVASEVAIPSDGVTCHVVEPARAAELADWPEGLPPALIEAFARRGIERPYSHQAEAIRRILGGESVVVVSPTSGGKSLCYAAPILARCLADPDARALLVFPTKALALDQAQALHELVVALRDVMGPSAPDIPVSTFDGDTPADARRAIRQRGRLVVTNPDMLHSGILPQHARWAAFFEGLTHVVIDELHVHRGVFGSHVANVLRRLRRLAAFHGRHPVFVTCSATIANPLEHATTLLGDAPSLVAGDGSPRGQRHVVLYDPPIVNAELGLRGSAASAARRLALRALEAGLQVIVFATSRLQVELLARQIKDRLARRGRDPGLVEAYRGGLLPRMRRDVQRRLRSGELRCVVATNALELGLDIGSLDVAILCGYPGSVASTWQQMGRAGRRGRPSACVLVARGTALDQHVVTHPEILLGAPGQDASGRRLAPAAIEHARLDPDNLLVLVDHLKCAAFELPFRRGESYGALGAQDTGELLEILAEEGFLHQTGESWHWTHESHPAEAISLRAVTSDNFVVIDASTMPPQVVAEVDFSSAPTTIHEKAIYIAGSRFYQVDRLDYDGRKAFVTPVECDYYTDAISYRNVAILESFEQRAPIGKALAAPALIHHGEVRVGRKPVGFKKLELNTGENLGYGDIVLPEHEMHTTSYWFTLSPSVLEAMGAAGFSRRQIVEGLSGAAHALHAMACLLLAAAPRDIETAVGDARGAGGEAADRWFVGEDPRGTSLRVAGAASARGERRALGEGELDRLERFEPTLFLFDNFPGGVGFSALLHDRHEQLVALALERVHACRCESGCPSCVGPRQDEGLRCRAAALGLLRLLAEPASGGTGCPVL